MTADRELLELAAKAAGYEFSRSINEPHVIERNERGGLAKITRWNPLTDDGDALRLAVKLGLCIFFVDGQMAVGRWYGDRQGLEGASEPVAGKVTDDRAAAVRRAVVRAAAEIGAAQ